MPFQLVFWDCSPEQLQDPEPQEELSLLLLIVNEVGQERLHVWALLLYLEVWLHVNLMNYLSN